MILKMCKSPTFNQRNELHAQILAVEPLLIQHVGSTRHKPAHTISLTQITSTLNNQATTISRALRRMRDLRRQQKEFTLPYVNVLVDSILQNLNTGITFKKNTIQPLDSNKHFIAWPYFLYL